MKGLICAPLPPHAVVWLGARTFFLRRQTALLYALSTPHAAVGTANPGLCCFTFQAYPCPFLAAGVRPLLSSITCPMLLPGSCQPHEENEFFYLSQSNRFGFCLHTCNSCSGSAPVPGVPRDSHSGLIRLLRTVTAL